ERRFIAESGSAGSGFARASASICSRASLALPFFGDFPGPMTPRVHSTPALSNRTRTRAPAPHSKKRASVADNPRPLSRAIRLEAAGLRRLGGDPRRQRCERFGHAERGFAKVQEQRLRDRHAWHGKECAGNLEKMLANQEREDDEDWVNLRGIADDLR